MKHFFKLMQCGMAFLLVILLIGCSVPEVMLPVPQSSYTTSLKFSDEGSVMLAYQDTANVSSSAANLSAASLSSSNAVTIPAPNTVKAAAVSRTSVKISWSSAGNVNGYFLKRYNPATAAWDIIAQTSNLYFTDNNCTANTSYRYHVVAYRIIDGFVYFAPVSPEASAATPQYTHAPEWISASPQSRTSITISWAEAAGADAYFLKRYNPSTQQWDIIAQTYNRSFTDNNLSANTNYRYQIVAYAVINDVVRFAPTSPETSAKTPLYAAAPTTVTASAASQTAVNISWSSAAGADAYFLKRYNNSTGEWDIIAQTIYNSFTDSNRTPGTNYRYHVVAYAVIDNVVRFAPVSAEASATTQRYIYAPASLTVSASGAYSVKIKWSASANAQGYALKRYNPSTGAWDILLQTTAREYTDNTCRPNTQYRYHVVAYRTVNGAVHYAPNSPEGKITTPAFGAAPASIDITAAATSITLSWSAASGASGYAVKRLNSATGAWDVIAQTADTKYTDKGLASNLSYSYFVVPYAVGTQTNYAASSAVVSAATPVVSGPKSVTAYSSGRNAVTVHWDIGDCADGYVLRRASSQNGPFTNIKSTTERSYTDTGLTSDAVYYYDVVAYKYIDGTAWFADPSCVASASPKSESASYSSAGYNFNRLVGLDNNGRAFSAVNGYQNNRAVGIMYWPWFGTGAPFFDDIYDISKILAKPNGFNELFYQDTYDSPAGGTHYWGEPLWGYYHSKDPYIIRKHIELLTAAGVDFLFFDTTNAWTYASAVIDIMQVIDEMQREGWNPPKIVFYTHSHSLDTIRSIYNDIYKKNLYPNTWYRINNKPVIIGYTNVSDDLSEAAVRGDTTYNPAPLSSEILNFFTFKMPQWPDEAFRSDGFPWIEFSFPQPKHTNVMNVSAASNPMPPFSFSLTRGLNNWGRGYDVASGANSYSHVFTGRFFQSSWDTVLNSSVKPEIVTVNGWNQWVAGKNWYDNEYSFCDVATMEFSADIEMMKGGYEDTYYQMLAKNIRAYKGNSAGATGYISKTININGSPSQWDNVNAVFRDMGVTNYGRDYINSAGNNRYVQNAPRNNIQEVRVTKDSANIYFYIRCADDIVTSSDTKWMNIFIGTGTPSSKGWQGYNYVVNRKVNGSSSSVEALNDNYMGTVTGQAEIALSGSVLQVKIPRSALNLGSSNTFYFKVADGVQNPADIMNFYTTGSSLPIGRLSFQYNN